jgi:hypothetical protein
MKQLRLMWMVIEKISCPCAHSCFSTRMEVYGQIHLGPQLDTILIASCGCLPCLCQLFCHCGLDRSWDSAKESKRVCNRARPFIWCQHAEAGPIRKDNNSIWAAWRKVQINITSSGPKPGVLLISLDQDAMLLESFFFLGLRPTHLCQVQLAWP